MSQHRGDHLDLTHGSGSPSNDEAAACVNTGRASDSAGATTSRPWIGVHFECCGVYQRVYRDASSTTYSGRCPRCGRTMRVTVGPGGVSTRFLSAR